MAKVTLRISEVARGLGITTAYQLQKKLGKPPNQASKLWKGELTKIGLETICELCEALNCQPGELFNYMPGRTNERKRKER